MGRNRGLTICDTWRADPCSGRERAGARRGGGTHLLLWKAGPSNRAGGDFGGGARRAHPHVSSYPIDAQLHPNLAIDV